MTIVRRGSPGWRAPGASCRGEGPPDSDQGLSARQVMKEAPRTGGNVRARDVEHRCCIPRRGPLVFRRRGWVLLLLLVGASGLPRGSGAATPAGAPAASARLDPGASRLPEGWAIRRMGPGPPAAFSESSLVPDATRVCGVVRCCSRNRGSSRPARADLGALVRARLKEESEPAGPTGPAGDGAAPQEPRTWRPADLRGAHPAPPDGAGARSPVPGHAGGRATGASGDGRDRESPGHAVPGATASRTSTRSPPPGRCRSASLGARPRPEPRLAGRRGAGPRRAVHPRRRARFGVPRLWGYPLTDTDVLYRFADYNAGQYASRNAAVQRALAQLTGIRLAADGDLLVYAAGRTGPPATTARRCGRSAHSASASCRPSPRPAFAEIWRRGRSSPSRRPPATSPCGESIREQIGSPMPTAAVPELELKSPKLRRGYSTGCLRAERPPHHRACLQRLRGD
jgi:hypothetical protein